MSNMDSQIVVAMISSGGSVVTALGAIWMATNQIGKRMDDLNRRFERFEDRFVALEAEFRMFKDVVMSKLNQLDLDVAKLMDRGNN